MTKRKIIRIPNFHPPTVIEVPVGVPEDVAIERWLKRHQNSQSPLGDSQRRREYLTVRGGKTLSRKNYNKH